LVGQELLGRSVDASLLQAAENLLLLGAVDAAVGSGSGDHSADIERRALVADRLRLKAGARWGGLGHEAAVGGCRASFRVIAIGVIGEAADQRERAELGRLRRDLTSGLG